MVALFLQNRRSQARPVQKTQYGTQVTGQLHGAVWKTTKTQRVKPTGGNAPQNACTPQ
jgi:hypothetical protein